MSRRLYVPVTQFYMDEELGFAYGTLGRAYETYEEARQFLLDGGWKADPFDDEVFGEVIEYFWKGDDEAARIDEVEVE